MTRAGAYGIFERELEAVRARYGFVVAGYVLMPEHVHLLVGEPRLSSLSVALQVLKQQTSRKLKVRGEVQVWQRRYYDFNMHNEEKRVEKLKYMHRNPVNHPSDEDLSPGTPVKRGLVEKPEQWQWSSFRQTLTGEIGTVEIESHWTGWRREVEAGRQKWIPPFAKSVKDGAPIVVWQPAEERAASHLVNMLVATV